MPVGPAGSRRRPCDHYGAAPAAVLRARPFSVATPLHAKADNHAAHRRAFAPVRLPRGALPASRGPPSRLVARRLQVRPVAGLRARRQPPKTTGRGCLQSFGVFLSLQTRHRCSGRPSAAPSLERHHPPRRYGDNDPPQLPITADIREVFGAAGDGITDDTAAFELAIATIPRQGALFVPEGTYLITRVGHGLLARESWAHSARVRRFAWGATYTCASGAASGAGLIAFAVA